MPASTYTVQASAAISQISATLAPLLTTSFIDAVAKDRGWKNDGSNKARKMYAMLEVAWGRVLERKLQPGELASVITTMVMEAYRRSTSSQLPMHHEDVDAVVSAMRTLRLSVVSLSRTDWRGGLTYRTAQAPVPSVATPIATAVRPTVHKQIVDAILSLHATRTQHTPQERGRRLEDLVLRVLEAERLGPRGCFRNPGEELDGAFSIDNHHYCLECKWETDPLGFPAVRSFSGKVERKAEGTFGVVLSMSGYVSDINESAVRGTRLNCIGLTGTQFMNVIEGRTTWTALVNAARRTASERSEFLARPR